MSDNASEPNGSLASPVDRHVGRQLFRYREEANMSLEQLGAKVGVPASEVEKWESGQARIPSSHLLACASLLRLPVMELFDGLQDGKPQPSFEEWLENNRGR